MRRPPACFFALWLIAVASFVGSQIIPLHLHKDAGFAGATMPIAVVHSIYKNHQHRAGPLSADVSAAQHSDGHDAQIDLKLLALAQQLASAIIALAAIALTLLFSLLSRPQQAHCHFAEHLFFRHWDGSHPPPLRAPPV